jgi:hypothetical protein
MRWQNFDGDNSIKPGITGFVHLTHSTRTEG